jgi:hypothetical protein
MKAAACVFVLFMLQNAKEIPRQEGMSTITVGDTETLLAAQERARSEALRNAVEKATGVQVIGDTIIKNSQLDSDFTRAIAQGIAFDPKIIESKPSLNESGGKWSIDWTVRLNAQVAPAKRVSHAFGAHIDLDGRTKFIEKENMHFDVEVGEDSYIRVFNVGWDESVTTLIPNRYHKEKFLRKGTTLRFPSAEEERQGIHLTAELPPELAPGATSSKEKIIVIATRKDNLMLGDDFREAAFKVYDGKSTGLMTDLLKTLYELDGADWAQYSVSYEIVKK